MEWMTKTDITPLEAPIDHNHHVACFGSCFAVTMAERFRRYRFQLLVNPFGILYNPESISRALGRIKSGEPYLKEELVRHRELWHSMDHHGDFSHPRAETALSMINNSLKASADFLKRADWCIITFGTAGVYRIRDGNQVAGNCHRMPSGLFSRERLTIEETVSAIVEIIGHLRSLNPGIRCLLTISPVRYRSEGFVENSRSKATLHLALEKVLRREDECFYFPSYELILDDLRDYRFFAEDLVHPAESAVDYVWERFMEACISEKSMESLEKVASLVRDMNHRPRFPESGEHRGFRDNLLKRVKETAAVYPFLDLEEDIKKMEADGRGID